MDLNQKGICNSIYILKEKIRLSLREHLNCEV